MLKPTQKVDTRVAILEERFNIYEKMMDKLENAIQTISEINQNISRMLSIHEEKIEHNVKNDDIIFEKFKSMEEKNSEEHQKVIDKIEKIEDIIQSTIKEEREERIDEIKRVDAKLSGFSKFRWLFVGGVTVLLFALSQRAVIVDILTDSNPPANIEKVK